MGRTRVAETWPSEPSQAKISDLINRSFEAQIQRLEAYWKAVGRDV